MAVEIFITSGSLRIDLFVVFRGLMRMCEQFCRGACLSAILVGWPCDLLPRALNVAVISQTHIGLLRCKSNHGKLCCTSWCTDHAWLDRLRLRMDTEVSRVITVNDIPVMAQRQ